MLHNVASSERGTRQGVPGIFLRSGTLLSGVAAEAIIAGGDGIADAFRNIYLLCAGAATLALVLALPLANPKSEVVDA